MDGMTTMSALPRGIKRHRQKLRVRLYCLLFLSDLLGIYAGMGLARIARSVEWLSPGGVEITYLAIPVFILLASSSSAYSREVLLRGSLSLSRAARAMLGTFVVLVLALFSLQAGAEVSRLGFVIGMAGSLIFVLGMRALLASVVKRISADSLLSQLVISDDRPAVAAPGVTIATARELGIQAERDDPYMMHRFGEIVANFDRVVICCTAERHDDWALLLKGANVTGEIVAPGLRALGALAIGRFGDEGTYVVARGPLSLPARAQKRAFDLLFTVPLLVALTPALLIVGILIKLDSRGPVFFRQRRIGRGNCMFEILKFRSMRVEQSDAAGDRSASRDDDRITRVGRFIRRTSIDELPQLINVLLGDMSLVGPRPHALGSLAGNQLFWEVDREYWRRHALKPGITGLAQVRGHRGATHHHRDLLDRLSADLEYLNDWSLARDLSILVSTVGVLSHRNAF